MPGQMGERAQNIPSHIVHYTLQCNGKQVLYYILGDITAVLLDGAMVQKVENQQGFSGDPKGSQTYPRASLMLQYGFLEGKPKATCQGFA